MFIEQISTKISIFSRKNHHFWVKILFFSLETYRNVQRKIQFSKNPIFPGCNRRQWRGAPLRRQAEFVRFHAHLLRRLFDETWTAGGKLRVCWSSLNFIETKYRSLPEFLLKFARLLLEVAKFLVGLSKVSQTSENPLPLRFGARLARICCLPEFGSERGAFRISYESVVESDENAFVSLEDYGSLV